MIVYDTTVSERYAHALFNVVKRKGLVDSVKADVEELLKIKTRDSKLVVFLEGPQFPTEDKVSLINRLLKGRVDDVLVDFYQLLLRKGRELYSRPILERFLELADEDQGFRKAEVSSAQELSDSQKQSLQSALDAYTKSKLHINYLVDPTLIGGVRFQMGDLLIDDTIKGKLGKLEFQLQEAARA